MRRTYIPKLDDLLDGGTLDGSSLMFCADPGVDGEVFGYQLLNGRVEEGDHAFIFTNVAEPEVIKNEFNSFGWDLETLLKDEKVFFVDGISSFSGKPLDSKYFINDYSEVEETILNALDEITDGVAIINSLSILIDYIDDDIVNIIRNWNEKAKSNKTTLIYIFTQWDYSKDLIESLKLTMDCVIDLKTIEERVIIGQGFMVASSSWTEPVKSMVLFFVVKPGGVKVYVPKILVTGPYNSGKSSFVKSISTKSVSVDKKALSAIPTTIAMDIGHVDYKGFIADIFGTPGQERFDLILDVLAKEAIGAFIVVDSAAPQTFGRAKEMIRKTRSEAIPKVILANKQDLTNALSPEEIRERMNLNSDIPIIPTIITQKRGMDESLNTLLKLIYGD